MIEEEWREILSLSGYEASSLGNVRSKTRWMQVTLRGKPTIRLHHGRVRKPNNNGSGYLNVSLGKLGHRYVHRLVAEAFHGPIPTGLWVCHNDGDPSNNKPQNLRYDTAANNEKDKKKHRTRRPEKSHMASLTLVQVAMIKELLPKFSQRELAEAFGVSQPTISRISTGFCWVDTTQ